MVFYGVLSFNDIVVVAIFFNYIDQNKSVFRSVDLDTGGKFSVT